MEQIWRSKPPIITDNIYNDGGIYQQNCLEGPKNILMLYETDGSIRAATGTRWTQGVQCEYRQYSYNNNES
jgi:hypothetical protein